MGKKKNPGRMVKDLKKDVVGDPDILKQELEVLIKNLNKEKNLQQAFVLRDEDVSDFDDGGESQLLANTTFSFLPPSSPLTSNKSR